MIRTAGQCRAAPPIYGAETDFDVHGKGYPEIAVGDLIAIDKCQ